MLRISIFLLCLIMTSARADWVAIEESEHSSLYLDEGSIERSDPQGPKVWVLFEYPSAQRVYQKAYRSSKEYLELDCLKHRYQVIKFILYPELQGRGGAIDISSGKGTWHEIGFEDPRAIAFDRLCKENR